MKHVIVGTAGHIDHGKTTLIKALTGRETDRLEEEKKRGISIELGFTYFDLPSGVRAGIIDVPGHEKFIKNMLAGVCGMDVVILVVAADEGVMAQTREHLEILEYTGIKRGIVALTKTDMVDSEWLEIAQEDVRETLQGTFLENAKIIPVSGRTKEGIDTLIQTLDDEIAAIGEKKEDALPRYGVDRVFTISGFGTVVTGTLVSGTFQVGQEVMLYPSKIATKIRNLQVHDENVDTAYAGQRVAINLANVTKEQIDRGHVLTLPNRLENTMMLDVRLTAVDLPFPLENRTRVRVYNGTTEVLARIALLDTEVLESKQSAYAQLRLEEEMAVQPGDHFVLRLYSPLITVGGGVVIDSVPTKKKRFDGETLVHLEALEQASTKDAYLLRLQSANVQFPTIDRMAVFAGITKEESAELAASLAADGQVYQYETVGGTTLLSKQYKDELIEEMEESVKAYQDKYPMRGGAVKESVRSQLLGNEKNKALDVIFQDLIRSAALVEDNGLLHTEGYEVTLSQEQADAKAAITKKAEAELMPFRLDDLGYDANKQPWAPELLTHLLRENVLFRVEEDLYASKTLFVNGIEQMMKQLEQQGTITVAEARDALGTNRKIAMLMLETMDQRKLTRREGDVRVKA